MSQTPGVIFDLDGTLADTLDDITSALNATLLETGRSGIDRDRARALIGNGLPTLLRLASGIEDDDMVAELVKRYRPLYADRMLERTRLYPGVAEMLDALAANGVPMSVLSNKPGAFTLPICEHYLSSWPFVTFYGHQDGDERKPDPTVALRLAERMRRPAGRTIFVGDSDIDISTAHNAGMISVGVTWGFRDRDSLESVNPSYIIDHPKALIGVVA